MTLESGTPDPIDQQISHLFALVAEALAAATDALLSGDIVAGQNVVDQDRAIDDLTADVVRQVWARLDSGATTREQLHHLVGLLLILPELERSADLAEHIAQRAVGNLGVEMSPTSRGIVQRMTEVALEMWRAAADAYADRTSQGVALDEDDEELDLLHQRLTREIAFETMSTTVAAQLTLLARFYERLGDHAVNLAHRIGAFAAFDIES
jgi:phosphate transport system protein